MKPPIEVGKWYDCVIYTYSGVKNPVAKINRGDKEDIVLVQGEDSSLPPLCLYQPVKAQVTRKIGETCFISDRYKLRSLASSQKRVLGTGESQNGKIALAIYDPVAKFLLWIEKDLGEACLQENRRLNPEGTGKIKLNGEKFSYGCRHLKTVAGVKELLARVGYDGGIRQVRNPGENSTSEKPTCFLEGILKIDDGSSSSKFLMGILEMHLASDIMPEVRPGDISYLTEEQEFWGTIQATRGWHKMDMSEFKI